VPNVHGFTVRVAFRVDPPTVAVRTTGVELATLKVVDVKVPVVEPAVTVVVAGTDATEELALVSEMVTPPTGATAARVTVPVETAPPTTAPGESVNAVMVGVGVTVTVSVAVFVTPE
jgi:hypothetical protein